MPTSGHSSSSSGPSSRPPESREPVAERQVEGPWREVPIDWESLEDAFENNAPEVHSYLHVPTGDVLRIVDGIADPQMHARIAADINYLRIEPVSSREQYRWMERYIPMVEDKELQTKLTRAIDGKGAFRRFKDVLMSYGPERERWFAFRSERLRIFMEAWLNAHALNPVKRPAWAPEMLAEEESQSPSTPVEEPREGRPSRNADAMRRQLRELIELLGPRELDTLAALGEFLKARRAGRRKGAVPGAHPSSSGEAPRKPSTTLVSGRDDDDPAAEPTTPEAALPSSSTLAAGKRSASSGRE
jgi:hypothetical protein